jgi:micrococcal nuclease
MLIRRAEVRMLRRPLALALVLVLAASVPARAQARRECRVTRVSDGDTFRAACPEAVRVRLLLVDSPERDQPPFGARARAELARLLPPGTPVTLELDVRTRDQYGRLLAYAFLRDGRMVNEEMVRSGFAVVLVYPPNVRYIERIRARAAEARAARRGLWAVDGFGCAPRDHRRRRC